MRFFCPQGIGDSLWALHKIRAVSAAIGDGRIELYLASSGNDEIQVRALPFLRRFPFLDHVDVVRRHCLKDERRPTTKEGYWDYVNDGPTEDGQFYALMPNAALERGVRLEQWLPEYDIDWRTMSQFQMTDLERRRASILKANLGRFVVFYPGPEAGNTTDGHNRGPLWTPLQWRQLGKKVKSMGLAIVAVGANYDRSYYDAHFANEGWHDFLGRWEFGQTAAVLQAAAAVIAYQSGVGIVSHYLGTPTAMWWRPKGNSASARIHVSFEEAMAHCWTSPHYRDRYLPLIYGTHGVTEIVDFLELRVLRQESKGDRL